VSLRFGTSLPPERRGTLHAKLGREFPAEVYEAHVTGHRVLVAPVPVSTTSESGLIVYPRSAIERAELKVSAGWIIAAGPLAGKDSGYQQGALCDEPQDLLGHYVTFETYSGKAIRVSQREVSSDWDGDVYVLLDTQLMTVSREEQV